jgi:enolase
MKGDTMSATIARICGREILDSRGNPTVEAEVVTEQGTFRGAVPSGASTGTYEAVEKRDGGARYGGKGVLGAVKAVNTTIAGALRGMSVADQAQVDQRLRDLDGTPNKDHLGANAILAVSIAAARAGAKAQGIPLYSYLARLSGTTRLTLPIPQMNVINGGKHAGIEDDIQEHLILPIGAPNYHEAVRLGCEVYHALGKVIETDKRCGINGAHLGDEGGYVPPLDDVRERLELIQRAIERAGCAGKVLMGLDCAASELYRDGVYHIRNDTMTSEKLVEFYERLVDEYSLVSIEDGMHEEDWKGWSLLTQRLGKRIQIVGDDLFVTNVERIRRGIAEQSANALLLKVNQIGTVSEAIDAGRTAEHSGWSIVLSHRSGETEDTFIADLAVGMAASQAKFGAPARTDRTAKYNQLLRIEEQVGDQAALAPFPFVPGRWTK